MPASSALVISPAGPVELEAVAVEGDVAAGDHHRRHASRRAASSASAGVGTTPQSIAVMPSARDRRGGRRRRSGASSAAGPGRRAPAAEARPRRAGGAGRPRTCAAQTASVMSATRPRRPLVPNFTLVRRPASRAAEIVLDPDDVVLLEIGAGLHLDDLDRDPARGSTAGGRSRAAGRSTRSRAPAAPRRRASPRRCRAPPPSARRGGGASAARAACRAPPRSASPGTASPRSIVWYQPQGRCTRAGVEASATPLGLELGDEALDLLRPLDRRDQHRVGGVDDREPARRRARRAAARPSAGSCRRRRRACTLPSRATPCAVARALLPDRLPVADVRPGEVRRQHRRARGVLHHRVVEADLRRLERTPRPSRSIPRSLWRVAERPRTAASAAGACRCDLAQAGVGAEAEHARRSRGSLRRSARPRARRRASRRSAPPRGRRRRAARRGAM